mgnify:CR=1 FL=1
MRYRVICLLAVLLVAPVSAQEPAPDQPGLEIFDIRDLVDSEGEVAALVRELKEAGGEEIEREAIEERLPNLSRPNISYDPTQPQLTVDIDRRRAADLGIDLPGQRHRLFNGSRAARSVTDDDVGQAVEAGPGHPAVGADGEAHVHLAAQVRVGPQRAAEGGVDGALVPADHPAMKKVPAVAFLAHVDTSPDVTGKDVVNNSWTRGACQYGIMPANGLIYLPAHACGCHGNAKLNGFIAMASTNTALAEQTRAGNRVQRGPAFGGEARPEAGDAAGTSTLTTLSR